MKFRLLLFVILSCY